MWVSEKLLKYIVSVAYMASLVSCANILAIIPSPSYSHQVAFFDIWNELSLRGHQVTLITTDPQKNEKLTNLTEIDMQWTYDFFKDISKAAERNIDMWSVHFWFNEITNTVSEAQLSDPRVQELIHNNNKSHFDVLIVESFYPELLGFAEVYNCPVILAASMEALNSLHNRFGNSIHPALLPSVGSDFVHPLNFKERVLSTIYSLYASYIMEYISIPDKQKLLEKFFNSTSNIGDLINKADMLFLSNNPVIQTIRTVGPNTINIGGSRQLLPQPLQEDLSNFLDSATNGFVYFSLGSNVKSKDLHNNSLKAIAETLSELPYKVLWKFEAEPEDIPNKLTGVKLVKWAPQLGVLAHPNIKAFVTQAGLQSMEEAIFNEVPCVAIPFFSDQQQNARLMKTRGIGITVGRHPYIHKDELKAAILEVINNPRYKNSVSNIKRLSVDTPMTGLQQAVWWTEYVIRHKGAKHLRNPAADLPLYQYYLLDVIGFIVLVVISILSVIYLLLKTAYRTVSDGIIKKYILVHNKLE